MNLPQDVIEWIVQQAEFEGDVRGIIAVFGRADPHFQERAIEAWAKTEHAKKSLYLAYIAPSLAARLSEETWLMWLNRQARRFTTPDQSPAVSPRDRQPPPAPRPHRPIAYRSLSGLACVPEVEIEGVLPAYRSLACCS